MNAVDFEYAIKKDIRNNPIVREVDVFGIYDHLDVWNHERFVSKLQSDPFTDEDAKALSDFGI